ncbi:MAG: CHASE4 domain-containing protein [Pseudanabaenaceae cyanobacterium SKYGB_i_bin29]|nr:ATP-binding protein [Pseudanabaenaceae cyanobacterium SKYG29]MDW8422120.1 CHASE4 domain-containing protein [Pseudanabaenaceae cyanobacterium SKYGB_i_bin29]
MKLRTKALLIVGSTITCLGLIVFSLVAVHTYRNYRRLEHKFVKGEVERISDILQREIAQLDRTTIDYATWDDTYAYLASKSERYISANYGGETLTNLQLNRISIFNSKNEVVFNKWFSYADRQLLKQSFPTLEFREQFGIAVCPENQIFILSMHPVLPSNKRGKSRGWLMMARLVDNYQLNQIAEEAKVKVKVYTPREFTFSQSLVSDLQLNNFATRPLDSEEIAGYTYLNTINGSAPLVLEVITNRYIYQQFIVGLQFFAIAICTIVTSITVVVLLLLDRLFLARLSDLDRQVQNIKDNPNLLPELEVRGRDELADLSVAIKEMLRVIEETRIAVASHKVRRDFLAIMNHELRTPMNAILGMAQLLQTTKLDEEQGEYVATIMEGGKKLLGLLDDMINYIRLEPSSLKQASCNIAAILAELQEKYCRATGEKELNLQLAIPADLPPLVITDSRKLQEILDRLLDNAIKFTPRGEIVLKVSHQTLGDSKINLTFTIQDTGIGIKKEDWERIFHPFVMVNDTMTRAQGGTGMGLAIVNRLCEIMGARIEVDSVLGKGTTFTVSLVVEVPTTVSQPLVEMTWQ